MVGLIVLAVTGLTWANNRFVRPIPGQDDFTTGWFAANMFLMKGISPYDVRVTQAIQSFEGSSQALPTGHPLPPRFTEPFYALLIFAPFSLVDIHLARALWQTVIELSYLLAVSGFVSLTGWKISPWALGILVGWAIFWYNGAHAMYLGQLSILVIFMMVAAMVLFQGGNEGGAGFLMALSLVKPELSLLVVMFFFAWALSTHRVRFYGSFLASLAFLFTVTLILVPAWPLQWVGAMVNSAGHPDWYSSAFSRAAFALPGIKKPLFAVLHIGFGLFLLVEWLLALKKDQKHFYWAWLLTLTISALIVPRSNTSVTLLILPVVFQLAQIWQTRWRKAGTLLTSAMLVLILSASWALALPALQHGYPEPLALFILPPLLGLVVLIWIRYWVIRPSRLPLDLMRDLD